MQPTQESIHVFLFHRHRLLRETLSRSLSSEPGIILAGSAPHPQDAHLASAGRPVDVALVDSVQAAGPLQMIRSLTDRLPGVRVLPVGLHDPGEILAWVEAGAAGYLLKGASFPELVRTVKGVHRGAPPCSPQIVATVCRRILELCESPWECAREGTYLTAREIQILELIGGGLSNKEIARHLHVSPATVKNHVHSLLRKLGAQSRSQAARFAAVRPFH